MALFRPYKILKSQLATLPKREGQLILVKDEKTIYLDISSSDRIQMYSDEIARIANLENTQYGYEVVQALPTQDIDPLTIYLVQENVQDSELKQYMYKNSAWYCIGSGSYTLTKNNGNIVLTDGNGNTSSVAIAEFSSDAQNKLNNIETNAQVNTIETIQKNGSDLTVTNKTVNITVPTNLSQLTNDNNTVIDANYTHTDNNYTNEEKLKLGSLAEDDKTWNGVTLNANTTLGTGTHYIPAKNDATLGGDAYMLPASYEPNRNYIAKFDNSAHLRSTTPEIADNSTKVLTSAFANSYLKYNFVFSFSDEDLQHMNDYGTVDITDDNVIQALENCCRVYQNGGLVDLVYKTEISSTNDQGIQNKTITWHNIDCSWREEKENGQFILKELNFGFGTGSVSYTPGSNICYYSEPAE